MRINVSIRSKCTHLECFELYLTNLREFEVLFKLYLFLAQQLVDLGITKTRQKMSLRIRTGL